MFIPEGYKFVKMSLVKKSQGVAVFDCERLEGGASPLRLWWKLQLFRFCE